MMRFLYFRKIHGVIRCVSGLRVGGSKETLNIGGVDGPIMRNPFDDLPYIPGSSIKGKIRSLLEWQRGKLHPGGDAHECHGGQAAGKCEICRIFGVFKSGARFGPGRAIFRDATVTEASKADLEDLRDRKGLMYVEEKMETAIDRLKGNARGTTLRTFERVPAGTEFDFSIDYRVFDMDDGGRVDKANLHWLLHGLWLLEQDALGSCGSRGYGQIRLGRYATDENGNPTGLFIGGEVYVDLEERKQERVKDRYVELNGDGNKGKTA